MKESISRGIICLKNNLNIEFAICKIEYFLYEDQSFKYVFTPYYDVIDLLSADLFQGLPGIEVNLRKKEYIRKNIVPTFISERVPSTNREDFQELLDSVGLSYMDPIVYLIKSKMKYSGDDFYVIEYSDRKKIIVEDSTGKENSLEIVKKIINNIAKGNQVVLKDGTKLNEKVVFSLLSMLYEKGYTENAKKQKIGIDNAKTKKKYKGRKPIHIDKIIFEEQLDKVEKGLMTSKEAATLLGISIDKFYRQRKLLKQK